MLLLKKGKKTQYQLKFLHGSEKKKHRIVAELCSSAHWKNNEIARRSEHKMWAKWETEQSITEENRFLFLLPYYSVGFKLSPSVAVVVLTVLLVVG